MKTVAAILAAGSSTRLGLDKTAQTLGGKPVWQWSYDTYLNHPLIDKVIVVASPQNEGLIKEVAEHVILGGPTRQESALNALKEALDADAILFHDAGRPFVTEGQITEVIHAIEKDGAAGVAIAVKDTIREVGDSTRCLDRSQLRAMQTPQGGWVSLFSQAYSLPLSPVTDDLAILESIGVKPVLVEGSESNFKITTMDDLAAARNLVGKSHPRIGSGYDVHSFSDDPGRVLMLGGVPFEGAKALDGHSDADALLHAVVDALLGAAALGDIGEHFQNTDPRWKNCPSLTFLTAAREMLKKAGYSIVNVDATVIAEAPKIMKKSVEIRTTIANALQIDVTQVSVKATTNEKMGFIGRSEGIAAFATAMIAPL